MTADGASLALVVGGDAPTRAMLRFLLTEIGCEVGEAPAFEAPGSDLDAAGAALLVMILDGSEGALSRALVKVRLMGCQAPIVVVAHEASWDLRQRAPALGVVDVVSLPADPRELQARLHVAIREPAQQVHPPAHAQDGGTGRSTARADRY